MTLTFQERMAIYDHNHLMFTKRMKLYYMMYPSVAIQFSLFWVVDHFINMSLLNFKVGLICLLLINCGFLVLIEKKYPNIEMEKLK